VLGLRVICCEMTPHANSPRLALWLAIDNSKPKRHIGLLHRMGALELISRRMNTQGQLFSTFIRSADIFGCGRDADKGMIQGAAPENENDRHW
jgi:hypothetical protein